MQRLHRLRIDFGRFRRRTALEHARGALKERFLPLVDHRRVYAEPARQFRNRLFVLQSLQGHARLERRFMLSSLRHRRSPFRDQQEPDS
jgi:hypothetical protein